MASGYWAFFARTADHAFPAHRGVLFSKGSKKFNDWFLSSRLYKKYLRDFAESRSMPLRTKLSIMALASLLLAIVFIFAQNLHVRLLIGLVWIIKTYYFLFRIKTAPRPLRGGAAK